MMDIKVQQHDHVLESPTATIVVHQQGMVEKWLLVLLIVGCTSLVFFICFPIDFFLYRRRKRLARERKNKLPIYQLRNTPRAEQNHARITHHHKLSAENEEINIARRKSDHFKAQIGFAKILSKLRKKSTTDEHLDPGSYENGDLKSENSTEFQLLSTTDCMTSTADKVIDGSESPYNALKQVQVREVGETLIETMKTHSGIVNERNPNVKISNLSCALDESEELVDHENKHLNYGALEPYGAILPALSPPSDREERCFTIPVNKGLHLIQATTGESCTDFEVFHDEGTPEKFEMSDARSRSKSASALFSSNIEVNRSFERYLDADGPHPPPSYDTVRKCEAMMFDPPDLPFRNNHRRPQSKVLEHSFSDHFISYNSGPGCLNTSSRKTKKHRVTSPPSLKSPEVDNDIANDTEDGYKNTPTTKSENFFNYENNISGSVFKTKKKKKVVSKRQSSESMPELTVNKEKF